MGSSISQLVDIEKTSWVKPHSLEYDLALQKEQKGLLRNFEKNLALCYVNNSVFGMEYQHWFVTDGKWVIEFGGGDITNNTVMVHCNPKSDYLISERFNLTNEVMLRMRRVCGVTNYSLALRNCEHVARQVENTKTSLQ